MRKYTGPKYLIIPVKYNIYVQRYLLSWIRILILSQINMRHAKIDG